MFSNELMLGGTSVGPSAIGTAGEQGFGVGVYPGDEADLTAIGLSPMDGCDDPTSDNYGNYIHTNGSVMCFVPAFCYRIGQPTAPSYERDGLNALEIGAPELDGKDNWILHRAFIDGGEIKSGFFFDKYLCSKSSLDSNIAISVKNGDPISLTSESPYSQSSTMAGCEGYLRDAITLSRARGDAYACASIFQWSAIAMLSLAHGQAATSAEFCAWYDSSYEMNFPKGNTYYGTDYNDRSITFTSASYSSNYSKTGSGNPFAKTTHNGQNCGICDVAGNKGQTLLGGSAANVLKESVSIHDITSSNYSSSTHYDAMSLGLDSGAGKRWGNGSNGVFFTESSGVERAVCGVFAKPGGTNGFGINLFGTDYHSYVSSVDGSVIASSSYAGGLLGGVFSRDYYGWESDHDNCGFRAAGYAS